MTVGTFRDTISEDTRSDQHDIGLVVLDGEELSRSSKIGGTLPVSGVTSRLEVGESLCALGMKTGTAKCGPIVILNQGSVVFRAGGQCGDSGAPVYLITEGTAGAVGILTRGGDPNHPDAGCSTPGTFSAAELV